MPVATSARPFDQAMTSAGMASVRSVGLDSGRTMGRSTPSLIASTIRRTKAPWSLEVPMRIVGSTRRTVSNRPTAPCSRVQPATSEAGRA